LPLNKLPNKRATRVKNTEQKALPPRSQICVGTDAWEMKFWVLPIQGAWRKQRVSGVLAVALLSPITPSVPAKELKPRFLRNE